MNLLRLTKRKRKPSSLLNKIIEAAKKNDCKFEERTRREEVYIYDKDINVAIHSYPVGEKRLFFYRFDRESGKILGTILTHLGGPSKCEIKPYDPNTGKIISGYSGMTAQEFLQNNG